MSSPQKTLRRRNRALNDTKLLTFPVSWEIDFLDLAIVSKNDTDMRFKNVARQVLDDDDSGAGVTTTGRLFSGPASGPAVTVLHGLVDSHLGVGAIDGSRRGGSSTDTHICGVSSVLGGRRKDSVANRQADVSHNLL